MTKSLKMHLINVITVAIIYYYDYAELSLQNYFQGNERENKSYALPAFLPVSKVW